MSEPAVAIKITATLDGSVSSVVNAVTSQFGKLDKLLEKLGTGATAAFSSITSSATQIQQALAQLTSTSTQGFSAMSGGLSTVSSNMLALGASVGQTNATLLSMGQTINQSILGGFSGIQNSMAGMASQLGNVNQQLGQYLQQVQTSNPATQQLNASVRQGAQLLAAWSAGFLFLGKQALTADAMISNFKIHMEALQGAFRGDQSFNFTESIATSGQVGLSLASLQQAETILSKFGDSSTQTFKLVANAAAATGETIDSIAQAIGRFEKEPEQALRFLRTRMGITVEDLHRFGAEVENNKLTGNIDNAVQALDRLMQSKFGDAAAQQAKTIGGQLTILSNTATELAGTFGKSLEPAVVTLTSALNSAAQVLMRMPEWLRDLIAFAGTTAAAILAIRSSAILLAPAFLAASTSIKAMTASATAFMLTPFGAALTAIAITAGAATYAIHRMNEEAEKGEKAAVDSSHALVQAAQGLRMFTAAMDEATHAQKAFQDSMNGPEAIGRLLEELQNLTPAQGFNMMQKLGLDNVDDLRDKLKELGQEYEAATARGDNFTAMVLAKQIVGMQRLLDVVGPVGDALDKITQSAEKLKPYLQFTEEVGSVELLTDRLHTLQTEADKARQTLQQQHLPTSDIGIAHMLQDPNTPDETKKAMLSYSELEHQATDTQKRLTSMQHQQMEERIRTLRENFEAEGEITEHTTAQKIAAVTTWQHIAKSDAVVSAELEREKARLVHQAREEGIKSEHEALQQHLQLSRDYISQQRSLNNMSADEQQTAYRRMIQYLQDYKREHAALLASPDGKSISLDIDKQIGSLGKDVAQSRKEGFRDNLRDMEETESEYLKRSKALHKNNFDAEKADIETIIHLYEDKVRRGIILETDASKKIQLLRDQELQMAQDQAEKELALKEKLAQAQIKTLDGSIQDLGKEIKSGQATDQTQDQLVEKLAERLKLQFEAIDDAAKKELDAAGNTAKAKELIDQEVASKKFDLLRQEKDFLDGIMDKQKTDADDLSKRLEEIRKKFDSSRPVKGDRSFQSFEEFQELQNTEFGSLPGHGLFMTPPGKETNNAPMDRLEQLRNMLAQPISGFDKGVMKFDSVVTQLGNILQSIPGMAAHMASIPATPLPSYPTPAAQPAPSQISPSSSSSQSNTTQTNHYEMNFDGSNAGSTVPFWAQDMVNSLAAGLAASRIGSAGVLPVWGQTQQ